MQLDSVGLKNLGWEAVGKPVVLTSSPSADPGPTSMLLSPCLLSLSLAMCVYVLLSLIPFPDFSFSQAPQWQFPLLHLLLIVQISSKSY